MVYNKIMLMQDVANEQCEFQEIHSNNSSCSSPTRESFSDLFKNTITNLAYNLKHSNYLKIPLLQREKITLKDNTETVYYLGCDYNLATVDHFNQHYRNTIWLSYRKGIKDIGDDRGWGCMIRAVQMLLAEGIKRLCGMSSKQVLIYFHETQNSELSLFNICQNGNIDKRWTSASQILVICNRLLKRIPMLNINLINETLGCLIPNNLGNIKKPTLIIIHNRLGIDHLQEGYLPHLKALIQLKYFSGMLGGTPGQAMFLLGYHNDRVIFLDPHYVQNAQTQDQTYFKRHPRGIQWSKLSPCVSICFSVANYDQYENLLESLIELQDYHPEYRAIQVLLSTERKQQITNNRKRNRKVSNDEFEVLE